MPLVADALRIARAAIRACDPAGAVRRNVRRSVRSVRLAGRNWVPATPRSISVVALGKAAGAMADEAARALGPAFAGGIAAVPRGYPAAHRPIRTVYGNHPIPGPDSVRAGASLARYVASRPDAAPVLFLVSGGGSATIELPVPPLTLRDLATTTRVLESRGVPIGGANAIRRRLSRLKGGGLARLAGDRPLATLAISDVVGDAPWEIASGPTVPDPIPPSEALRVVREYRLGPELPSAVVRRLRARDDTPPAARRPARSPPNFALIATNRIAREAGAREADRLGYRSRVVGPPVVGEASRVGARLARELERAGRSASTRLAILSGGETTVTLPAHPGKGGRSQELALAAATVLDGTDGLLVLAIGSDGIDGPTDAAGGWADGTTAARARSLGIDLAATLASHASYDALGRLGRRITTGPTGTNVADLQVRLALGRTGSSARPRARSTTRRRRS